MTQRSVRSAAAFFIAALALYGIGLGHTPIYLHDAEILFGLQAHSIATTGRDLNGRLLPLYFQMLPIGDNVWFHPVLVYTVAAFLQVLPFAEWSVRFPSALVGAIDVTLIYLIGVRLFGRPRYGAIAAGLLLFTPAHIIHSRLAMDYIYPLPFVLGWLLALSIYLERRNTRALLVGSALLGVGVYSYIASVVMMPVYLGLTILALWWTSALNKRTLGATATGFLLPLLAIPLWLALHSNVAAETLSRYHANAAALPDAAARTAPSIDAVLHSMREGRRFVQLTGRLSLYWYFFDPSYLFVTGGYANVVNSTRHVGVFVLPLIVLVPLGLYRLLSRPSSALDRLVLAGFITAPLAACIATVEPNAIDRELEVVPFGVLAAVYGFVHLSSFERGRLAARVLLAVVPLHAAFFAYDYLIDYRGRSAAWFEFNHRGTFERIIDESARQLPPAIYLPVQSDQYMESYWRFTLTKERALHLRPITVLYTAASLRVENIPRGSLVVMRSGDAIVQKLVADGILTEVAAITEPADPPQFFVLRR